MARPHKWLRLLVGVSALPVCFAFPAIARAQPGPRIRDFEQCENQKGGGPAINHCEGAAWVTGVLNHQHSVYREGDYVPFRVVIDRLTPHHTYTLTIGYTAVFNGLHAYDYLGSYDASAFPGQRIVPCSGVADTAGAHACGTGSTPGPPSTLAVPEDTHTTFPPELGGSQAPGHFSAWGARLRRASYDFSCAGPPSANCGPIGVSTTGTVDRRIDVTFTAAGTTVVLAWGGHIASILDWGAGRTYTSEFTGAPFHMKLPTHLCEKGGECHTTGEKDLGLHAQALAPRPGLTTSAAPSSVTTDQTVIDTATLTATSGRPLPTGQIQFFICGPNSAGPPDCRIGGTPLGPPQVVNSNGQATIKFPQEGAGPIATGHYCFRAEYSPSDTTLYSPTLHTDQSEECFDVTLPPPRLTVTKICDPLNDPGLFNLELITNGVTSTIPDGTDVPCTNPPQARGPFETSVGTHTVTESAGTGTNLADYEPPVFGGECGPTGLITLALGEDKTCTITNVRLGEPTGFLTVEKICTTPGDSGNFEIHLNGIKVSELACGETTDPIELAPGAYTVSEAAGEDTSLADYKPPVFGGDCPGGAVTIVANATAHCTITNERIPPTTTLEVKKLCDPADDNGRFGLTIDRVTRQLVHQSVVGCGGTTGAVHVDPGTYVVGETDANGTDLSKYDVFIGGDCEPDGTISVEAGDEAVCTITNVLRSIEPTHALLTVTKICVPADDGGRFNLTINTQTERDVPCGHSFGPIPVVPGLNHVGESAGTGTSLGDYTTVIGGACATDGSVTLAAGEEATCTVTNERTDGPEPPLPPPETGTVAIEKRCSPAGTTGHFQVELDQHVFRLACGQSTGPVEIGAGDHRVGEVAPIGAGSFTTTISGDCSPSGSFTLGAGQHVVCVVTNTVRPVEPPLTPPSDCYMLSVRPRMVRVGRVRVVARVHLGRRGIQGVRVFARAPGVSAVRTTGANGRAVFHLLVRRRGILRVTIRQPFDCPKPPPANVGILGVKTPPVTG